MDTTRVPRADTRTSLGGHEELGGPTLAGFGPQRKADGGGATA